MDWKMTFLSLLTVACFWTVYAGVNDNSARVCIGTEWELSQPESQSYEDKHYNDLKLRYTNCTYVEGNLEISYLRNREYDLSFLKSITEVTGYILIMLVYTDIVPLNNLQVIRGETLYNYEHHDYALYVALNKHTNVDVGVGELRMPSLHEIVRGEVRFINNDHLCYVETINWGDLRPGLRATIEKSEDHVNCSHEDYQCHESCPNNNCWGPGPDMCQSMTLLDCSQICDYRCRGPTPADCCYKSCAAGCHNSSRSGCFACRHFTNGDECVVRCPPKTIYNHETFQSEPNPDFKLSYGSLCLDECPDNVLKNDDNCVKQCPPGKMEQDKMCVECDGSCLQGRTCTIDPENRILYAGHFNNGSLSNCTKISGSIIVAQVSLVGDPFQGKQPVTLELLEELSTVREITGFLSVQAHGHPLDQLSFLRNLEVIKGHELYSGTAASLHIGPTTLESLDLQKLKQVIAGDIDIRNNRDLCYISRRLLQGLTPGNFGEVVLSGNKSPESCIAEGKVCHEVCKAEEGCWGPEPDQCSQCAYAQFEDTCLPNCNDSLDPLFYVEDEGTPGVEPMTCGRCDAECLYGCEGPGVDQCTAPENSPKCRNAQDGPFCRAECPQPKYEDENGICQDCHANCRDDGCTGPGTFVGEGGCHRCHKALLDSNGNLVQCIPLTEECSDDYFADRFPNTESQGIMAGTDICQECDDECDGCTGSGPSKCKACQNYKQGEYCVQRCDARRQYPNDNQICSQCHRECTEGCHGGTNYECTACAVFSYVDDANNNLTACVSHCPESHPYQNSYKSCVKECPEMYHVASSGKCTQCNAMCLGGCYDNTSSGCFECKHVNQTGSCQTECTVGRVAVNNICLEGGITRNKAQNKDDIDSDAHSYLGVILGAVGFFLVLFVLLVIFVACRLRNKEMVSASNIPMNNLDEER